MIEKKRENVGRVEGLLPKPDKTELDFAPLNST